MQCSTSRGTLPIYYFYIIRNMESIRSGGRFNLGRMSSETANRHLGSPVHHHTHSCAMDAARRSPPGACTGRGRMDVELPMAGPPRQAGNPRGAGERKGSLGASPCSGTLRRLLHLPGRTRPTAHDSAEEPPLSMHLAEPRCGRMRADISCGSLGQVHDPGAQVMAWRRCQASQRTFVRFDISVTGEVWN